MELKNANQFDEIIKEGVTLVNFFADWCGPCKMLAPSIIELETEFKDKADVVRINVDAFGPIAQKYGVMSIPTVIVFKDGAIAEQIVGFKPKNEYEAILNKLV